MEPSQYSFIECFHYLQGTTHCGSSSSSPPLSSRGSACPHGLPVLDISVVESDTVWPWRDWLSLRLHPRVPALHRFREHSSPQHPRVETLRGWGGGSLSHRMMLSALVSDRCCWHLKVLPPLENESGRLLHPDAMPRRSLTWAATEPGEVPDSHLSACGE